MTLRNMTEVFILMRNNAIKNRNMYEDRVSVVQGLGILPCHQNCIPDKFVLLNHLFFINGIYSGLVIVKNYYQDRYTMLKRALK